MDRDKIVIQKIKEAVKLLDEIDEMIESQSETLQQIDLELSDYYHLIENNELNEEQSYKVIQRIKELRKMRRSLNNENLVENTYQQQKSKLSGNQTRQFLIAEIMKTEKQLNLEYKNRIINDETIKELFGEPKRKVGRPRKADKDVEKSDSNE